VGIQSEIMMNDVRLSFFCNILHLQLQRACKPLHLLNNTDVCVPNGATNCDKRKETTTDTRIDPHPIPLQLDCTLLLLIEIHSKENRCHWINPSSRLSMLNLLIRYPLLNLIRYWIDTILDINNTNIGYRISPI
jgi:hypothetical protein